MATVPTPSPPRRAPPSASDSATATSTPTPHSPKNQVEGAPNNGDETKPDFADGLDHLDSTRYIERFRKYNDEYRERLLAKYFSGKSINGGNIIYEQITVGDEIIKSSRLPCLRSYADPVVGFEDQCSNGSSPPADTQANIPNGKPI